MSRQFTLPTTLLLVIPPLLWSGDAIVGRLVPGMVSPITFNFLRWVLALVILLPLAYGIYRPGSGLWQNWRRFSVLGLLGIGMYTALQYLALRSSTPINVTLVAASIPIWMLLTGRLFFGAEITLRQISGAVLSIAGVLLVLCRGELRQLLALRFVPGDMFMILATFSWSLYSWLLTRNTDLAGIYSHWASFLLAQVTFGAIWSGAFAAGEWTLTDAYIRWSWPLAAALLYVAAGPAVVAFRCWSASVQRVGPSLAGFFNNLTPLFAAIMSSAFLGELPHLYHGIAFLFIVGGIVLSTRR